MQEPFTLYKLIILYMLDNSEVPLASSQIDDFVLNGGYTDFLTLRNALGELKEGNLISSKTYRNRSLLSITDEGKTTLSFFINDINAAIRKDIEAYLYENRSLTKERTGLLSDYKLTSDGEYEVTLTATEKNVELISLKLRVPTESIASEACAKWSAASSDIYKYIVEKLY